MAGFFVALGAILVMAAIGGAFILKTVSRLEREASNKARVE